MNRHPEGDCPARPGDFFLADLGGVLLLEREVLLERPGVLHGVFPFLGVFLYFITNFSGVLVEARLLTLGVLIRSGELTSERGVFSGCLVGTICHLSTGAGRGCFSRMSSFSWASITDNKLHYFNFSSAEMAK